MGLAPCFLYYNLKKFIPVEYYSITINSFMTAIRPLSLTDRSLVNNYLCSHPPLVSELTFTNLFIWRHSRPVSWTVLDNSLLFFVETAGTDNRLIMLGPPVGDISLPEVSARFGKRLAGAIRLSEEATAPLRQAGPVVIEDRDNADYVYRQSDLAELAGRRYAKKRNKIKQCKQNYTCRYEPLTVANLAECRRMQTRWCETRECGHDPGLCGENMAIDEIFAHFPTFYNLIGGAIRVDGTIQAYAMGERLHAGTAVCHFEKAMPAIPGLGQLMNQWFAEYGLLQFEFINREQDLGVPGLRQAKESYYPHHLVNKYTLFLAGPFAQEPAPTGRCASED